MSPSAPTDAVAFHSEIAPDFHASYEVDPNRRSRTAVWRQYIEKYITPGRLAYDLGCGSGMVTCEIAPYAQQVLAIDGSDSMLAIAKKTTADRGFANVAFRQSRLPIPAPHSLEAADFVISSSVIEYLDSVEDALTFIHGILKPSGILIFSISNRDLLQAPGGQDLQSHHGASALFRAAEAFPQRERHPHGAGKDRLRPSRQHLFRRQRSHQQNARQRPA